MNREKHRNLIISARAVVNLTDCEVWTYGTSGALIRPESKKIASPEELSLSPDVYYIVSDEMKEKIMMETSFNKDRLLEAHYIGRGRGDVPIYHFINHFGAKIVPITEQTYAVTNQTGFIIKPA